jgi:hypothetical protein
MPFARLKQARIYIATARVTEISLGIIVTAT